MKKRIGCLHAHYSNIKYIEKALSEYELEFLHFVEPGLHERVSSQQDFQESFARQKVKDQINWIASCKVDAILITCTAYVSMLQEADLPISVPIIKIDEPFFAYISQINIPQAILFTNPATVEGTMARLEQYMAKNEITLDIKIMLLPNVFDYIMRGLEEKYSQKIYQFLLKSIEKEERSLSVAQLSMVHASELAEQHTAMEIGNPLRPLVIYIAETLNLKKRKMQLF